MCTRHRTKTNNTENEKDEQYGPSQKPGVISGGREGYAVAERYQKGSKGYRQYSSSVQKMKCRSHIVNQLQGAIPIRKKLYVIYESVFINDGIFHISLGQEHFVA